ncbi:MAG: gliding motility-associated C-terminal domain-containing protein [Saprospiraceae bacterium]
MPLAVPANDITYLLTITDENGCTFTDEVNVFVQKARNVYAPSAFSPNNDALNDEFTLFTGQQVSKINNLLIFDRWGALMFEQYNFEPNNLSIGWDGQHKGQMMNPGVYVWFAEVEFLDGQVELYEGEVILIR